MIKEVVEFLASIVPGSNAYKEAKKYLDSLPSKKKVTEWVDPEKEEMRYGKAMRAEAQRRLERGDFDVHD